MYERGLWVKPSEDSETLAEIWNPYFNRSYKHFCSHNQTPVEKDSGYPAIVKRGNIIYFAYPIFSMYKEHGMKAYKQLVDNSLKLLLKDKIVETNAPTTAHININYQPAYDRYIAHIRHYIPERRCNIIDTIEDVIPLYNIDLKIKLPKAPAKVYCAPSMQELDFDYEQNYVKVVVPEVKGHQMVVFEF